MIIIFRAQAICAIFPVSEGKQLVTSGASLNQSWKNSIRIFNQIKLILRIAQVRALKSQLVSKIEFSKKNQWSVFSETTP